MDSHQNTYKISFSLISINFPKEITPKAMTALLTIVLGVPLSLLFWIYSLNSLISLAGPPMLSKPSPVNNVIETNR